MFNVSFGRLVQLALVLLVCAARARAAPLDDDGATYCAFTENKVSANPVNGELTWENVEPVHRAQQQQQQNTTIQRCSRDKEFCYTLWFIDPLLRNRTTILLQGCWDQPGKDDCPSECITTSALTPKNIRNITRFCCCLGNMCNVNVTDNVNLTAIDIINSQPVPPVTHYVDPFYSMRTIIISLTSVFVVALLIVATFAVVRCCFVAPDDPSSDPETSPFIVGAALGKPDPLDLNLDDLKVDALLSRGRYGEVYRAVLGDAAVAVKMLCPAHRQYYYNEREIFSLPLIQHPGVVGFFGARERPAGPEGPAQYLIVTAYEPLGTLGGYLKNNTVDWATLCRMAHSVIGGIAHLHTELSDGDKVKPTIAHRDINSRNILVRADLTCCICDFGFAMKIFTSRLMDTTTTAEDLEEHASLADVGTLRYMAPEVLEGSVNLYDCKSSLTQVDIYAYGLVLWEMGTRCHELYQGLPTPNYQLPFEQEVGLHPSFEDMQVLVSRNKTRPAFPDTWKDTNQAIKAMKDTIEECWDQDAEARISAVCVEERTREMATLWENRLKYVTAYGHLKELEDKAADVLHNMVSAPPGSGGRHGEDSGTSQSDESNCSVPTNDGASLTDENSVSTLTVETLMSPMEGGHVAEQGGLQGVGQIVDGTRSSKDDCNALYERNVAPVRAHQGSNPTFARNTHKSSDEELAVSGNQLVARGAPTQPPPGFTTGPPTYDSFVLDMIAAGGATVPPAPQRVGGAVAVSAPPAPPASAAHSRGGGGQRIAYTQNAVDDDTSAASEPTAVRPKKQNIPSNGGVNHLVARPTAGGSVGTARADIATRLSAPFKNLGKMAMPYLSWGGGGTRPGRPEGHREDSGGAGEEGARGSVPSEVMLVNGATVTRPKSLALNGHVPSMTRGGDMQRVGGAGLGVNDSPSLVGGEANRRSVGPDNVQRALGGDRMSGGDTELSQLMVEETAGGDGGERPPGGMRGTISEGAPQGGADPDVHPRVNYGFEASTSPRDFHKTCIV